jgi:hypothetical protein
MTVSERRWPMGFAGGRILHETFWAVNAIAP